MDKENIDELIRENVDPPCFSVYLNLRKENFSTSEILAAFNSLLHQEIKRKVNLKKENFRLLIDEVRKTIRSHRLPSGDFQAVSIFLASNGDFVRSFFLRHPFEMLSISSSFYLSPLIRDFNETLTFCFCLANDRKARLLVLSPFELMAEIIVDNQTPEKVKSAGWYGLEEKKISRHIEEHVRAHFQKVAGRISELLKRFNFDYLVLSLNSKNSEVLKRFLKNELAIRLVEGGSLEINTSLEGIKRQAKELEGVKIEKAKLLLREKIESELAEGRAVTGLESFLRAWNEGLVESVLIGDDFESQGFVCLSCQQYQLKSGSCFFCGSQLEETEFLIDRIAKECFTKNTEVQWLKDFPPGVGAILRTYLF